MRRPRSLAIVVIVVVVFENNKKRERVSEREKEMKENVRVKKAARNRQPIFGFWPTKTGNLPEESTTPYRVRHADTTNTTDTTDTIRNSRSSWTIGTPVINNTDKTNLELVR